MVMHQDVYFPHSPECYSKRSIPAFSKPPVCHCLKSILTGPGLCAVGEDLVAGADRKLFLLKCPQTHAVHCGNKGRADTCGDTHGDAHKDTCSLRGMQVHTLLYELCTGLAIKV
ncbi:hypothetical protein GJAV_G00214860 [Gymnothorax javanicus]|nr:hypothetical protein GJAV_G00214860 [Gymnothorax javanicus]